MILSSLFLTFTLFIPSFGSAIELDAERECRDALWQSRVGALVSFTARSPNGELMPLTGILERIAGDTLDFGHYIVPSDRVVESSVTLPEEGDLVVANVVDDTGRVRSNVIILDRVGVLPVTSVVGAISVIKPGAYVWLKWFRVLGNPHDSPPRDSGYTTFEGRSGTQLRFSDGRVPLLLVTELYLASKTNRRPGPLGTAPAP